MSFRHRLDLDGVWNFQIDPHNRATLSTLAELGEWRQAQVPLPWQAQFEDLRHTSGVGWYQRTFTVEQRYTESAILHFNAVDYQATIWVNGEQAGTHEGGYLPFEVDVTHLLRLGKNELVVRVADPTDDATLWPDFPFSEIPHGKQSWYGPISGIWQSVWLEWRPPVHFLNLRLTPLPREGVLEIDAQLSFTLTNHFHVEVQILDPDGAEIQRDSLDEHRHGRIHLDPASLVLWSALHRARHALQQ
jgi:beta-galactosidase/beta-glucuronidase